MPDLENTNTILIEESKENEPVDKEEEKSPKSKAPYARQKKYALYSGTASSDIQKKQGTIKTEAEEDDKNYRRLKKYLHDGEILWGTVYGVEDIDSHIVLCVLWNNIRVIIPSEYYFEPEFVFCSDFENRSEEDKLIKMSLAANRQQGAEVCFQIIDVSREKETMGPFAGQYIITAIGNRTSAMAILRDIYFWHENRKHNLGRAPRSIKEGDIVDAKVISVRENTVLVEVAGVETRLGKKNLKPGDYPMNCHDYVKPGDILPVRIKNLFLNDDHTVHLGVTGRIYEANKLIETMKIGSCYLGTVESYNPRKRTYRIILHNGVPGFTHQTSVVGLIDLLPGDKVAFYLRNKYQTFVFGTVGKIS